MNGKTNALLSVSPSRHPVCQTSNLMLLVWALTYGVAVGFYTHSPLKDCDMAVNKSNSFEDDGDASFKPAGKVPDGLIEKSCEAILRVIGYNQDIEGLDADQKEKLIASNVALKDLDDFHTGIMRMAERIGASSGIENVREIKVTPDQSAKTAAMMVKLIAKSPDHTAMVLMVLSLGMIALHTHCDNLK